MDGYGDANWVGCQATRKSTFGLALFLGKRCVRTSSSTQQTLALSVGESEFYSAVKTASVLLGLRTLCLDWGLDLAPRLHTNSGSARGICSRRGVGNVRHLHTQTLWIQGLVSRKSLTIVKCPGTKNPADLMTKVQPWPAISTMIARMGLVFSAGRASIALNLQTQ